MKATTYAAMAAAVGLASCSPSADLATATRAIDAFHASLNAGDFQAIYQGAAPQMRSLSTEADFTHFVAAVHRKLGLYVSGRQAGLNDSLLTGGHFVAVRWAAKFQRGDAAEDFTLRLDGGKAALVGYHVNSNALIEN